MTFESTGDEYANNYTSFPYVENIDRLKIAHVIHGQTSWDAALLDIASNRGSGFLYVTDDIVLNPTTDNPCDTLSSYWSSFTSDIQLHNAAAVPEPSSIVLFSSMCLGLIAMRRRGRTKQ